MLWHSVVLLFIISILLLVVVFIPPQSCRQEILFKSKTITGAQKQFIVLYTVLYINRCLSTTTLILKACVQLLSRSTHNPPAFNFISLRSPHTETYTHARTVNKARTLEHDHVEKCFLRMFSHALFAQLAPSRNNTWLSSSSGTSYWSCSKDDWDN